MGAGFRRGASAGAKLAQVEEELREYANLMSEAERIAHFGAWKWDLGSDEVRWSDELHSIYGLEPGEFEGTVEAFTSFLHPGDRERIHAAIQEAITSQEPFGFEERIIRRGGQVRYLYSQGRALVGDDGETVALVGVCHDVTERTQAEQALGVSRRRIRTIVDNLPSVIAVKDLEGRFVETNLACGQLLDMPPEDLIGMECSTLFPPAIAAQLRANDRRAVEENDAVYDEVVLMRGDEPRTHALVTFPLPDSEGNVTETCTIGTDVTERKEREDERRERVSWQTRIGSALAEGRMQLHAQPVFELKSDAHVSSELLIRMAEDGRDELLPPAMFLPEAERFGLIQAIDVWVLDQALRLAPSLRVEVNLSGATLEDADARRRILQALSEHPEQAERIIFEITETAAVAHIDAAIEFAEDLTALGCGLALDDFGTGFGSFTYLRELPLRYLKIDRSFVAGIVSSEGDKRVVRSIIRVAEEFGIQTIAEGVETAGALALLRDMGADLAQGFHLGRPEPIPAELWAGAPRQGARV